MDRVLKTITGTVIVGGIEFNQLPVVPGLVKATEYYWACKLRDKGLIRLNSIEYYHHIESNELGDKNEGRGLFHLGSDPIKTESSNEVFIWCSALPDTSHKTLTNLNNCYDSIISICNVEEFVIRISASLRDMGFLLTPQVGAVSYNRGHVTTKEELNSQKWQYNVFQKDAMYAHQCEFRLAFTNSSFSRINNEYIDLSIGECSDIVHVQKT